MELADGDPSEEEDLEEGDWSDNAWSEENGALGWTLTSRLETKPHGVQSP